MNSFWRIGLVVVFVSAAAGDEIGLITLDPGHFHAALFQKEMLPGVSSRVHVYAPLGPDLLAHLGRVSLHNSRKLNPTTWELEVHASPDCLERLVAERPGNVVILSGNNQGKIDRIEAVIDAGLHVLADKPWVIDPAELPRMANTMKLAREKRVAAYDGMTQRFEISCLVQKALVNDPAVFGSILTGTPEEPAVLMESVHYIRKDVAGAPLIRPVWFFDPDQQGEPLADIGTHLVDLVQWTLFPEQAIDYKNDVRVLNGSHGAMELTLDQFRTVTGAAEFPPFLLPMTRGDRLDYIHVNTVDYALRDVHVRLKIIWEYEGGVDTEFAVFRGSKSNVEVRQGAPEQYIPEVYVIPNSDVERTAIESAIRKRLSALGTLYPGLELRARNGEFQVLIPQSLRTGHEAHFTLLVNRFLDFVKAPDTIPAWEDGFMMAKYYVTTEAIRLAREKH